MEQAELQIGETSFFFGRYSASVQLVVSMGQYLPAQKQEISFDILDLIDETGEGPNAGGGSSEQQERSNEQAPEEAQNLTTSARPALPAQASAEASEGGWDNAFQIAEAAEAKSLPEASEEIALPTYGGPFMPASRHENSRPQEQAETQEGSPSGDSWGDEFQEAMSKVGSDDATAEPEDDRQFSSQDNGSSLQPETSEMDEGNKTTDAAERGTSPAPDRPDTNVNPDSSLDVNKDGMGNGMVSAASDSSHTHLGGENNTDGREQADSVAAEPIFEEATVPEQEKAAVHLPQELAREQLSGLQKSNPARPLESEAESGVADDAQDQPSGDQQPEAKGAFPGDLPGGSKFDGQGSEDAWDDDDAWGEPAFHEAAQESSVPGPESPSGSERVGDRAIASQDAGMPAKTEPQDKSISTEASGQDKLSSKEALDSDNSVPLAVEQTEAIVSNSQGAADVGASVAVPAELQAARSFCLQVTLLSKIVHSLWCMRQCYTGFPRSPCGRKASRLSALCCYLLLLGMQLTL